MKFRTKIAIPVITALFAFNTFFSKINAQAPEKNSTTFASTYNQQKKKLESKIHYGSYGKGNNAKQAGTNTNNTTPANVQSVNTNTNNTKTKTQAKTTTCNANKPAKIASQPVVLTKAQLFSKDTAFAYSICEEAERYISKNDYNALSNPALMNRLNRAYDGVYDKYFNDAALGWGASGALNRIDMARKTIARIIGEKKKNEEQKIVIIKPAKVEVKAKEADSAAVDTAGIVDQETGKGGKIDSSSNARTALEGDFDLILDYAYRLMNNVDSLCKNDKYRELANPNLRRELDSTYNDIYYFLNDAALGQYAVTALRDMKDAIDNADRTLKRLEAVKNLGKKSAVNKNSCNSKGCTKNKTELSLRAANNIIEIVPAACRIKNEKILADSSFRVDLRAAYDTIMKYGNSGEKIKAAAAMKDFVNVNLKIDSSYLNQYIENGTVKEGYGWLANDISQLSQLTKKTPMWKNVNAAWLKLQEALKQEEKR